MRFVLKNGTIHDGKGKSFIGDILIENEIIADIGRTLSVKDSEEIDISGLDVMPGIIDSHRHADFALIKEEVGVPELSQGITTTIVGPCGMSVFPASEAWYAFMKPCLGENNGHSFSSCSEYLDALEGVSLPINVGTFVGMGAVRSFIKGFSSSPWSKNELSKGNSIIIESLKSGAFGISCGIMYIPECYSTPDDYVELLRGVSSYNVPLVTHMRSEGDNLLSAVKEVIDISKKSGLKLNISHFKVFGKTNWRKTLPLAIDLIENERLQGIDVSVDMYPYGAGATTLMTLIPPICIKESPEETISFLLSDEGRSLFANEIGKKQIGWDNMVESIGWDRIIISNVSKYNNKWMEGLTVTEIANKTNLDECDVAIKLLEKENGQVGIIVNSMDEKDVESVALLPYSRVISDSLYGSPKKPHPRLFGSFPRFLKNYSLSSGMLELDEAISKMTGDVADYYSIDKRGTIAKNNFADLVVFDRKTLSDYATFQEPCNLCEGIKMVFVNGRLSYKEGQIINNKSGKVLRRYEGDKK